MDWSLLATLLHVLTAFVFVAGLIGRWVLLSRAQAVDDVERIHLLTSAAAAFERMVVLGSMAVLPAGLLAGWARGYDYAGLGASWVLVSTVLFLSMLPLVPFIFLPGGRRFEVAMSAARAARTVTPALRAAFADRAVSMARTYEVLAVLLIIGLMVLKPNLW